MELRTVQHSYKYRVSLHPVIGGVHMNIFEIQLLFTQKLANVENLISVLFRAESEGDVYTHEWYDSWHNFPEWYPLTEGMIQAELRELKLMHPGYRLSGVK